MNTCATIRCVDARILRSRERERERERYAERKSRLATNGCRRTLDIEKRIENTWRRKSESGACASRPRIQKPLLKLRERVREHGGNLIEMMSKSKRRIVCDLGVPKGEIVRRLQGEQPRKSKELVREKCRAGTESARKRWAERYKSDIQFAWSMPSSSVVHGSEKQPPLWLRGSRTWLLYRRAQGASGTPVRRRDDGEIGARRWHIDHVRPWRVSI